MKSLRVHPVVNQVYMQRSTMLSLQNIMRTNAASCLLFGILFGLLPNEVAIFLGGASPAPQLLIFILGCILVVNGLHLAWASTISLPKKELVLYFSAGDFIWVIASIGLLTYELWVTTTDGILAATLVALMVGFMGVMQMVKRTKMEQY